METRSDIQAFSFPSTPWEGLDRDHAPMCLQWMGEQWPMDSGGTGGALPDLEILNTLDPLAAQRAKAYLAIQAFWHALEQAQATPENKVPWGSDYDVLDGQDDADLSFTALSDIRLEGGMDADDPSGRRGLYPGGRQGTRVSVSTGLRQNARFCLEKSLMERIDWG